jgi:Bacterial Ig-like domain
MGGARTRALAALSLGLLALLIGAGPATAYVTTAGGGAGSATTATVGAPGTPTATATPNTSTVPVSWSASTLSTGQAVQGYYVLRVRSSDQSVAAACGSSASALLMATSCTDQGVTDGTYRYQVVAVVGSWTASSVLGNAVTVVNDTSVPSVAVTSATPAANASGWNNTSPVTVTVSATPGSGGIQVSSITAWVDSGTHTTTIGSSATVSVSGDGVHTVSFYATDALFKQSATVTYTVRIDTAAPAAPSSPRLAATSDTGISSTDGITKVTTPVVTGTAEAGSTVTVYDAAAAIGSGTAASSGTYSIATSALVVGSHSLTAKATDLAGNTSVASSVSTVVVDTTGPAAPAAPTLASASDSGRSNTDKITNVKTPAFTGTAEASSTVTLYDATSAVGTGTASGGSWSITSSSLGDGVHNLTAQATDAAGNTSTSSAATSVTIDTLAPNAPSKPVMTTATDTGVSTTDGITKTTTPTFAGTTEKKAIVILRDNGVTIATSAAVSSGNYSLAAGAALSNASHPITATATDVAGNVSSASTSSTAVIDTVAPTVTMNQAAGQADPTSISPVSFTGVFSEVVYGLTASDITFSGTAGATTVTIVGSGPTYTFNVSGMPRSGTVIASIGAGQVTDTAGNTNTASTSTDNTVTYNHP